MFGADLANVEWRKSSYSNGQGGACVEVGWHKSSYSNGQGGDCVEVRRLPELALVRDSKQQGTGPILSFAAPAWHTFLASQKGN